MFGNKNFMESQTKEVKISEVSVEVVDQFLMFLYTGRLKDKRREGSDEPVWVEMLPQLVYISQKVRLVTVHVVNVQSIYCVFVCSNSTG